MTTLTKKGVAKDGSDPKGGSVDHIFVYGTLRNRAKAAERMLLSKYGERLGVGQVHSAALFLGKYPYAVPDQAADSVLVGEVYRLDKATQEDVLLKLDAYEEYDPKNIKGSLYRREIVKVVVGDRSVRAWIYWYNGPLGDSPLLRSGNYLKSQMHVVPNGQGWQVKVAGVSQVSVVAKNKVEAVKQARKLAGRNHMMVVIHGRDGRIQERIPSEKE